ncbi:MAG: D-alanyl-D-alanine carboxypeptidase [Clostridia bacterium]|nr:D-alanyl-D-alanine carboxypeptidase [Clostridia bacterium]
MKKLVLLLLVIVILTTNAIVSFAEPFSIDAGAYVLMDSKSGQILYEHNADAKLYPASTTKILTAIVALENGKLDQMMKASLAAVNEIGKDGMNIGIMEGEELDLEHLLQALMISSANETANIIAENISPTRKEFVDLMNKRAAELGAINTHFSNPCGAHDKNHYTTAKDMAILARHGMTIPKFREIAGKTDYRMLPTNKHAEWPILGTTNKLFGLKSQYYSKVLGIKTGYTEPAGNNLASAAIDNNGMELIAVVMDVGPQAGRHAVFRFSKDLLEYGFKNFAVQKLQNANDVVQSVQVLNAKDETPLDITAQDNFECVLPKNAGTQDVTSNIQIHPEIKAPIKQGDVLGSIEYQKNNTVLGKVNLVASRNIEEKPMASQIVSKTFSNRTVTNTLVVIALLLALFILLRITLRRVSRKVSDRSRI